MIPSTDYRRSGKNTIFHRHPDFHNTSCTLNIPNDLIPPPREEYIARSGPTTSLPTKSLVHSNGNDRSLVSIKWPTYDDDDSIECTKQDLLLGDPYQDTTPRPPARLRSFDCSTDADRSYDLDDIINNFDDDNCTVTRGNLSVPILKMNTSYRNENKSTLFHSSAVTGKLPLQSIYTSLEQQQSLVSLVSKQYLNFLYDDVSSCTFSDSVNIMDGYSGIKDDRLLSIVLSDKFPETTKDSNDRKERQPPLLPRRRPSLSTLPSV
jgi:hypothetical protein